MATLPSPLIRRPTLLTSMVAAILCSLSFFLGSYTHSSTPPPPPPSHDSHQTSHCSHLPQNPSPPLDFNSHHHLANLPLPSPNPGFFETCPANFSNHCPCHDPAIEKQFRTEALFHRERHCPDENHPPFPRCLVPPPVGYRRPFPWPRSRDVAWFNNVPYPRLTVSKKAQNWVRLEGDRLVFPGGGTSFTAGAKEYVKDIGRVVPLKSGSIRTVLDTGCGVASFGAALMDFNILTMSIAPRDIHEAQVQFALERGLPAMLGVLSTYRLPYPSRSFDMAHCSRCLVPWTNYDGLYLMEIDRVLRPGGFWVLSGPPINWKAYYKGWKRPAKDLEREQSTLENFTRQLCWKKVAERGPIAVWRKPTNHIHCIQKSKILKSPPFCAKTDPDAAWYVKMEPCITPLPKVTDIHARSGGALENWPKRLNAAPSTTRSEKITSPIRDFNEDNQLWKKRVSYYGSLLKSLSAHGYRNIMNMNAGLGGFAAALSSYPVWVMNVVPFDAQNDTLGIVYDRGLIGAYMNWCEAFSTYPRTYDLIHADGVFSLYMNKCDIHDILFEMYRILRPEGAVIIRDHVDIIVKLKAITDRMRWNGRILHSERGPLDPEKILFVDNSISL